MAKKQAVKTDTIYDSAEIEMGHEHWQVIGFRANQLVRAGFTVDTAEKIAEATSVDWHTAVHMHSLGCNEKLIMEILL